jgi:hypothetical protein
MILSPAHNDVLCVAAECGRVHAQEKILFGYTAITGSYATGSAVSAFGLESRILLGGAAGLSSARDVSINP